MASIFKDGGIYRAQVLIFGKRRSKNFQTKAEAKRWALEQEVAKEANLTAASGLLVSQFVDRFISEENVDRHFASTLRLFANSEECNVPIRTITTEHIDVWIDGQLTGVSRATGRSVKTSSVQRRLESFSTFFRWCIKHKLLKVNPVRGHKKLDSVPHRERTASKAEIKRLLHCASWDGKSPPDDEKSGDARRFPACL